MIDIAIAGGGPAGLATAVIAARAGLQCTVFEPRPAPIDKACGEGLMPGAVLALEELGIRVPGMPFRGIRYVDQGRSAVADFPQGLGRGVRRVDLHLALYRAAVDAGVTIAQERLDASSLARSLAGENRRDHVEVNGVRARYLVGADGLHSQVRQKSGLAQRTRARHRWGTRAHFAVAPWTDRVEVHWNHRAEAYVTPVAQGCVGVAVLSGEQRPFADQLGAFPHLSERLDGCVSGEIRGAGPMRQQASARVRGRVLLVGDAAGYVDALTGEGLTISFACAKALVERIAMNDPAGYDVDYREITRRYRHLTSVLLHAAGRPMLRRRLVPLAARYPWVFRQAVARLAG